MSSPALFLFTRHIDGAEYSIKIPCRDWAEAEAIAEDNGWRLDGTFEMEIPAWPGTWIANLIVWCKNRRGRSR